MEPKNPRERLRRPEMPVLRERFAAFLGPRARRTFVQALAPLCAALALGSAFSGCAQGVESVAAGGGTSVGSAGESAGQAGAQAGSGASAGSSGAAGTPAGGGGNAGAAGGGAAGSGASGGGTSGAAGAGGGSSGSGGSAGNAGGGAGQAGNGGGAGQAGSGGSAGQAGGGGAGGGGGQAGSGGSGGQAGSGGSGGQAGSGGSGGGTVVCAAHPIPAKTAWKVTASSAQDISPVANMTDGNLSTRWSSGVNQKNDWVQVDFGTPTALDKITLMLGNNAGDYPRSYQVRISNNPLDTAIAPLASGNGQQATDTVVSFATPALGRYLLVSQVGTVTGTIWWSVAELTLACTH